MIPRQAVEEFKHHPPGRVRKQPPGWRIYSSTIQRMGTHMKVTVLPDRQDALNERLKELLDTQQHLLTGTVQRSISCDVTDPSAIYINLEWKDNEMPDQETHIRELEDFKAAFADILDWDTAQIIQLRGLAYT